MTTEHQEKGEQAELSTNFDSQESEATTFESNETNTQEVTPERPSNNSKKRASEQARGECKVQENEGASCVESDCVTWAKGKPVPYAALSSVFERVEEITSRTEIIELVTNLYRAILSHTPDDLLPCIYLTINKLAPPWEGLELGIGESILIKSIADATGRTLNSVKSSYKELGDLGLVAQNSRGQQRTMFNPPRLTIRSVYSKLKEIAKDTGQAAMNRKRDKITGLLVASKGNEARYIVRSLQGKLRIGLAERSVLTALARAAVMSWRDSKTSNKKSTEERLNMAIEKIKMVFSVLPSYDRMIPALLEYGIDELDKHCFLTPGCPVHPMLAQPTKGVREVLHRFTDTSFTCEYKYDGERAQIHILDSGSIQVYSRNLENNTERYPDIVRDLPTALSKNVKSGIIDCEAVAFDRVDQRILPFQVLSTRARKAINVEDVKVNICLYAFDLLYYNGQSLVKEPLAQRRKLLHENFQEVPGEFTFAVHRDTTDVDEIQEFLDKAVKDQCEGLMVKTLHKEASYEPSRRSYNWLKVKKDYLEGISDSLDLVPIGAFIGRGKRTGVYGAYLLACFDEDEEVYQSICKIGTGFSDTQLTELHEFFKTKVIAKPRPYYLYDDSAKPDVWFEPCVVWEVKAADLSISPLYKAAVGMVDETKGISLRFPRFIRVREDKPCEEASTAEQVASMYNNQAVLTGGAPK